VVCIHVMCTHNVYTSVHMCLVICTRVLTDVACSDASSDDEKPVVTVDTWLTQAEVKMTFECQEVTSNGYTYPTSVLLLFLQVYFTKC